ncbi:hypothetical protein HRED_04530, partial [Candidatus Haloredivivus sp. G17]
HSEAPTYFGPEKPASLKFQMYFYQLGKSSFKMVVRGIPALIIGILFLNVGLPSFIGGIQFLFSIFLTLNLAIALSYTSSMLVFWTKVGWSLRMTRTMVAGLFSGAMIPLYLVPDNIRAVFNLTPFPSMVDAPISIYQGTAGKRYPGIRNTVNVDNYTSDLFRITLAKSQEKNHGTGRIKHEKQNPRPEKIRNNLLALLQTVLEVPTSL